MENQVIEFLDSMDDSEIVEFYSVLNADIRNITAFFDIEQFKFYINSDEYKMSDVGRMKEFKELTTNDTRYEMINFAIVQCRKRL